MLHHKNNNNTISNFKNTNNNKQHIFLITQTKKKIPKLKLYLPQSHSKPYCPTSPWSPSPALLGHPLLHLLGHTLLRLFDHTLLYLLIHYIWHLLGHPLLHLLGHTLLHRRTLLFIMFPLSSHASYALASDLLALKFSFCALSNSLMMIIKITPNQHLFQHHRHAYHAH